MPTARQLIVNIGTDAGNPSGTISGLIIPYSTIATGGAEQLPDDILNTPFGSAEAIREAIAAHVRERFNAPNAPVFIFGSCDVVPVPEA